MAKDLQASDRIDWLEASGLLHIFRTLGLAIHPAKLGIGLIAIILTFALGMVLDAIWKTGGAVDDTAIARFVQARELDQPFEEPEGERGIFEVWREHERRCILGLLGSSLSWASFEPGTPVGNYVATHSEARPLRNFIGMVYGVWWLSRHHTVYFVFFALGALLIWSWAGGAICRIATVQFAREEKLTMRQALSYGWEKLFGGFFLAPCIPLIFILITSIVLLLGGMLLRVPILGDLVGGLLFGLAIFGGFIIAILWLGLLVGGSLFWPAVAAEGSDAFDAFSRGLSYPLSKPWKAVMYAIIAIVFASICWVFVNLFTFFMLTTTRAIVGFGTSPFGWWSRGGEDEAVRKLDLLWPLGGPNLLYQPPDWSSLQWNEYFSAALIGFFVLLTIGLLWSFLASFYFSGSTVVYHLLRRDVDGTDLDDVYMEEEESGDLAVGKAGAETTAAGENESGSEGGPSSASAGDESAQASGTSDEDQGDAGETRD
jgi:hypothetical protein